MTTTSPPAGEPQSTPFANWLKAELRKRGISMSQAARNIGSNPQTVHSWLQRDGKTRIPEDGLRGLLRQIETKTTIEELKKMFSLTVLAPGAEADRDASSSNETLLRQKELENKQDVERALAGFYHPLTADGLYVLAFVDELPVEWLPRALLETGSRTLVDHVRRGVKVLYLVPDKETLSRWQLDLKLGNALISPAAIVSRFKEFLESLKVEGIEHPEQSVALVQCDASPIFALGHKYGLIWTPANDVEPRLEFQRTSALVPFDVGSGSRVGIFSLLSATFTRSYAAIVAHYAMKAPKAWRRPPWLTAAKSG